MCTDSYKIAYRLFNVESGGWLYEQRRINILQYCFLICKHPISLLPLDLHWFLSSEFYSFLHVTMHLFHYIYTLKIATFSSLCVYMSEVCVLHVCWLKSVCMHIMHEGWNWLSSPCISRQIFSLEPRNHHPLQLVWLASLFWGSPVSLGLQPLPLAFMWATGIWTLTLTFA